jgi:hypothetical protein
MRVNDFQGSFISAIIDINLLSSITAMATLIFDTLKFVHRLRDAGIPENQAEAFKEASGEAEIATKRDIERVEGQLREMKAELTGKLTLVQWMLALVVAAEAVPLLSKLFN